MVLKARTLNHEIWKLGGEVSLKAHKLDFDSKEKALGHRICVSRAGKSTECLRGGFPT